MITFREALLKARAKSQYAIGKNPNSHRKRGSAALPETVVGAGHDGLFVHGTSSKGAKAIVANGPSLSSGSNEHGANEFGAALYLSEHDRGQQALHFSAGARDKLVEFTLAKGTRLLDVRGDIARTARHSLDGGQGVLKFKKTPEWHDDFVEHSLSKITDQYKKFTPDWESRVRGSLTIGSKDFDVNSYTSRLKTYVKDKGMAGVRFHDETVLFDASVVVKSRVMSAAEKLKVTARTAATAHERPKGSLFEKREVKLFSELYKVWDERKHPRRKDGKFGTGAGVGSGFSRGGDGSWTNSKGEAAPPGFLDRLKTLRVPPAWKDVRLNPDHSAGLAAVGFDAKGRKTALYTEAHHEAQAVKKFARLKRFTRVRDAMVKKAHEDALNGNDDAAVLHLISKTGIRIGSERNTGAKVQAYGASTLQARHVRVEGSVTHFDFVGKKGVHIQLTSIDPDLARVIKDRLSKKKPDEPLFNTSDSKVRDYMHSIGGKGFMPKDFRTYVATSTALGMVQAMKPAGSDRDFKKARLEVAKKVSSMLGNTPAMAISSYIDPAVWHHIHPTRTGKAA